MSEARQELIARLQRRIRALELRPGERLGTERELAERFEVPRSALRSALAELEAVGTIRRTMGATGGIFIGDGKFERRPNTIEGVPAMLRRQGVAVSTAVLRAELRTASPAESRALRIGPDAKVVRIERRRDADGTPWSLDTSVLPAELVPGLLAHDLTGSLYGILADVYRLEPEEADETIEVVEADDRQAGILGVEPGSPLFEIWRTARDQSGRPVEFARDFFRADRMRMHMRRYGARWKRVRSIET